eukprot:PRCOL_00005153-RA
MGASGPARGEGEATALLLPARTAHALADSDSFFGADEDLADPPKVTWLTPPKGHVKGGTEVTIYGSRFKRSKYLKVRFAIENEFDEVDATFVSESEIRCISPERDSVHTAHVTASNDGVTFSGYPLVYTKGSGTFLKFIYDNSAPGCLDCLQGASGMNPSFVNEVWRVDNATGPYIGGTEVTISSIALSNDGGASGPGARGANQQQATLYGGVGSIQRYSTPTGGPGAPHPFSVDPTSEANGPPITGTFYPHVFLKCQFECEIDHDVDSDTATIMQTSEWVHARWIDYTRIMCVSPFMTPPKATGLDSIPETVCKIRVSNNMQTFDELADTHVTFTYADPRPTVTNIKSNQHSVWPARGPFMGNTEVTVIGTNFLPSKYLSCRFGGHTSGGDGYHNSNTYSGGSYDDWDDSHIVGEPGGKVRYISSTEIICTSPVYGPASQTVQYYPRGGCCAQLTAVLGNQSNVESVTVVNGGSGYTTPPKIVFIGGGGCCVNATATIGTASECQRVGEGEGCITGVTVHYGGKNFRAGAGAAATAIMSEGGHRFVDGDQSGTLLDDDHSEYVVSTVQVDDNGSGYLFPPGVVFSCASGGYSCFYQGDVSGGTAAFMSGDTRSVSPGIHARAHTVLENGEVVRIVVTYGGKYYSERPVVTIVPQPPGVKAISEEIWDKRNRDYPPKVGYYSHQGKGAEELDPSGMHVEGASSGTQLAVDEGLAASGHVRSESTFPDGSAGSGLSHDAPNYKVYTEEEEFAYRYSSVEKQARAPNGQDLYPLDVLSAEGRGPLLPAKGLAFMDGSIKPGHQALIRVSNNYAEKGADLLSDPDLYGDVAGLPVGGNPNNPFVGNWDSSDASGYWIWSISGQTKAELDKCRVSNNPPVHQFGTIQGHGTDSHLGLGVADLEHDNVGSHTGFNDLTSASVSGAPGVDATAEAILSDCPDEDGDGLPCYVVKSINITNPGKGYRTVPTVTVAPADYDADGVNLGEDTCRHVQAKAILSGGTVYEIVVDQYNRGLSARGTGMCTRAPIVTISAAVNPTAYDGAGDGSTTPDSVGHNVYNLDETANSVFDGRYKQDTNMDFGHGAFPGHPGNENLGHPNKDCIYFLYSDIYVSPSGSDETGQGTAGRPYRTIQRCLEAALNEPRMHYVYKRADGGDRDPAVPGSTSFDGTTTEHQHSTSARHGTESAGMRVDATGDIGATGYDKGYTGTRMAYRNGRITGRTTAGGLYGASGQSFDTRDTQKGFGYYVNRDRCVLKDGVYRGLGNSNLSPHGKMVEVWAENAHQATIDCGEQPLGLVHFNQERNAMGANGKGSVSMHGVVTRRCTLNPYIDPQTRPYYLGRPGYGPGARNAQTGEYCWPGSTGCQAQAT